jgi:hypothetical protein
VLPKKILKTPKRGEERGEKRSEKEEKRAGWQED